MANTRIVLPDSAFIVDTYGGIVGIENAGKVTYLPRVIDSSGENATHTGDTNEATLATIMIPGGCLGENGMLRLSALFAFTASTNLKTLKAKIGALDLLSGYQNNSATIHGASFSREMWLTGSANGQVVVSSWAGYGDNNSSPSYTSIDFSQDQVLTITGKLALGTESVTLNAYCVEVFPR